MRQVEGLDARCIMQYPMHTDAALPDEPLPVDHPVHTRAFEPPVPDTLDDPDDEPPASRGREGLPKTYRSRHDRHYVEQLSSASGMPLLRMLPVSRIDAADLPDPSEVATLTASVRRLGVLQPLLVRAQHDRFVLIAGRKRLVAAREAQCRDVPCLVHSADDARAEELAEAANTAAGERRERVSSTKAAAAAVTECDPLTDGMLPDIQHALSTVQRSLRLLPQAPAATRERVAMRLIAAELERAQWLIRARRYLAGRVAHSPRSTTSAELMKEIRAAAAGIALHGGTLEIEPASADLTIPLDAPLLVAAVHGLCWVLLALGETTGDPRARVTLGSAGRSGSLFLTVGQPSAVLSEPALIRFFEPGWRGRPGGQAAEIAVQLARYAAARHGADLEVSSGPPAGTAITMTFR